MTHHKPQITPIKTQIFAIQCHLHVCLVSSHQIFAIWLRGQWNNDLLFYIKFNNTKLVSYPITYPMITSWIIRLIAPTFLLFIWTILFVSYSRTAAAKVLQALLKFTIFHKLLFCHFWEPCLHFLLHHSRTRKRKLRRRSRTGSQRRAGYFILWQIHWTGI